MGLKQLFCAHRPAFARPYDSSKVGDPDLLPRGRMLLAQDPTFYRSVHLGGVENIKLQKEALEKEKVREVHFYLSDISTCTASRC